jgi:hypothetical protein
VLGTPSAPSALLIRWPGGRATTTSLPENAREITVNADGELVPDKLKAF